MQDSPFGIEDDVWLSDLRTTRWSATKMSTRIKWYAFGFFVWTLLSLCNPGVWMVIYALV